MDGQDLLNFKTWAVVGDVQNTDKWAYKILQALAMVGYRVYGVDPRGRQKEVYETNPHDKRDDSKAMASSTLSVVVTSLKELPEKVDVIDLVVNPLLGLKVLEEAAELEIDKVLIQPGASSPEILEYCKAHGILVVESCALVELKKAGRLGSPS
ncbi:MAG: CoA-binding protein [Firmicutes bacterium]|nr:CoA-binding protein [Bacillota bacterium]